MQMTFPETSSALLRTRPTRPVLFVVTACILLWPLLALGQAPAPTDTAPNSSSSAQTAPQEAPAPPPQPAKTEFQTALEATASRVRDLLGEKLDPAVDPTTLFDVALDDERLIGIEKERLRLLLRGPEASVLGDAGVEQAPAKTGKKPTNRRRKRPARRPPRARTRRRKAPNLLRLRRVLHPRRRLPARNPLWRRGPKENSRPDSNSTVRGCPSTS